MERHTEAKNEILSLMNSRLGFSERAASAVAEGRVRLEERVERLESRVDALEQVDDS
jgi:hypothetical protein